MLKEAVKESRKRAWADPPQDWGGFLQIDSDMKWDDEAKELIEIDGHPIDPNKVYNIGVLYLSLNGMNRNQPLIDWANGHAAKIPHEE